eukprot:1158551-Pelagomonas_calceolata.AAC.1
MLEHLSDKEQSSSIHVSRNRAQVQERPPTKHTCSGCIKEQDDQRVACQLLVNSSDAWLVWLEQHTDI